MSVGEVGRWDAALHARYKALPPGPEKRRLASRLIRENEPLIKSLVAQFVGTADSKKRRTAAQRMGGKNGFHAISFDDAMQSGRWAMAKALDSYEPCKAGISIHLAWKVRYELQKQESSEHLAHVPKDKEGLRPGLGLVGMPSDEEDARQSAEERGYFHGTSEWGDIAESSTPAGGKKLAVSEAPDALDLAGDVGEDGFELAAAELEGWRETGVWPAALSSVEAWRAARGLVLTAPPAPVVYSIPAPVRVPTWWENFLSRCALAPSCRRPVFEVYNDYRIASRLARERELTRPEFVASLGAKFGAREVVARIGGRSVRVLAGVRVGA